MTNSTKEKLQHFAALDTFDSGHPLDMTRFYLFVSEAYKQDDIGMDRDDFKNAVKNVQSRATDDFVDEFYTKYQEGLDAIRVHETGKIS